MKELALKLRSHATYYFDTHAYIYIYRERERERERFFRIKIKKYTNKRYEYLDMITIFIDVLEGSLQRISLCCQMIILKGSIFKFTLNV